MSYQSFTLTPQDLNKGGNGGLGSSRDPYLILDGLNLTLQLLNCLLQLSDLDFGLLHAVPMKLGTCLKLPVLGGGGTETP